MDLDDLSMFSKLDTYNRIADMLALPDHLLNAWNIGNSFPIPEYPTGIKNILLSGMGESASAGELAAVYAFRECPLPLVVLHNDELPAWANGPETLVVTSSLSGNTEEILAVYEQALFRKCSTLAITKGGRLFEMANQARLPVWQMEQPTLSGSWFVYLFGALLAFLSRQGFIPVPGIELEETVQQLHQYQEKLSPNIMVVNNPAKRLAGQMVGRSVCVFAPEDLAPIARRWKNQINLLAKGWAQHESMPEAAHNCLAGINHPDEALIRLFALFISASSSPPRNLVRLDRTRQMFLMQGINTDFVRARGKSRMANLWNLLQLGDYTAYYLAAAYGEDPTPVEIINMFKEEMSVSSQ